MTKKQAQELLKEHGFAWTVTEVATTNQLNLIYCDWNGKKRVVYYSNRQKKIVKIDYNNWFERRKYIMVTVILKDKKTQSYIGEVEVFHDEIGNLETEFIVERKK